MAKKTLADMKLEDPVYFMSTTDLKVRQDVFCGVERTSTNNLKIHIKPYISLHLSKTEMTSWLFKHDDCIYWLNEQDAYKESLKRLQGKNIEFRERQEKLKQDTKNHMNDIMEVQQKLIELNIID